MTRHQHRHFNSREDAQLRELIAPHGDDWRVIAQSMPSRTRRQCRERWRHYLSPDVEPSEFTPDEDARLLDLVARFGQHWKQFEPLFPGRVDSHLKNRHRKLERRANKKKETEPTPDAALCAPDDDPDVYWDPWDFE
jgi:hypothetical protein